LEHRTLLATITVTSTDDSVNDNGQVTLRAAIESIDAGADVNSAVTAHRVGSYSGGNPSPDEIAFDIPGSGVQTIDLTSALPSISKPIFIDGYTQPGASANTDSMAQGLDSVLLIQIAAASAGYLGNGLNRRNSGRHLPEVVRLQYDWRHSGGRSQPDLRQRRQRD
jgi:hypothetical protein